MDYHLVLKDLSKRFGEVQAVKDLNLQIKKGELVTLLGPSGCGKTTTMHMIAGFHRPDRGEIILNGHDITYKSPYKRKTPMVFQEYALFPHLTVFENVAYGLKVKKEGKKTIKEKVDRILEQLGIPEIGRRFPNQLSGGQQQRVALARALVLDPEVLLLDEPLSNLDAKLRVKVRYEIKQLQDKFNITMIYVTHDQEEALSISDKVAVMNQGLLEQFGEPWEIYHRPRSKFVAEFVGETNFLTISIVGKKRTGENSWHVEFDWQGKKFGVQVDSCELEAGQERTLLIRPEALYISDEKQAEDGGVNYLEGKVIRNSFLGTITRYWVAVDGKELIIDDSKTSEHGIFSDHVYLRFGNNVHFL